MSEYKCENCSKEISISVVRLQMLIDESYKLKIKNNKLLAFVNLIEEHNVNYYGDLARELLQEIGEL